MYGRAFYDNVADAVTGFLPPSLRNYEWYRTAANLKLWYGEDGKEHYEVQILKRGTVIGLEIGFHAEHKDPAKNDEVVAKISKRERSWRSKLGKDPEIAPFIGQQSKVWRRISEVWEDRVDDGPETVIDAADRLATYIKVFEPLRTS